MSMSLARLYSHHPPNLTDGWMKRAACGRRNAGGVLWVPGETTKEMAFGVVLGETTKEWSGFSSCFVSGRCRQ